ncbi:hypothetical protein PIB30_046452 [Stylosanthes scabra]|uniref:Uncharacterized protein n=1 Tax=Stylosanthes scabra TaxID=79078 RepID=A0ABU6QH80_9FABA|nr:hypothetical protein [Stylosanthes scabra]
MASSSRKRKGKSSGNYKAAKFKSLFHEDDYNRLTKPIQAVGYSLVREFYANAWIRYEERNQPLSYSTFFRGKDIIFSPEAIHHVLNLRSTPIPNAVSYHDRKQENDLRLDEVLQELCVEGA